MRVPVVLAHEVLQGLLRRWYIVLIGILATAGLAGYVFVTTPPTFEAKASVVLVPPLAQIAEGSNPFLYMGGLEQALAVLTVRLGSPAVAEPILGNDADLTYSAARDTGTAGPIIVINAEGNTQEATLRVLDDVVKAVPTSMKFLQDELDVSQKTRISILTIVQDSKAKPVTKSQMRLVLAVVGAGLVGTLLATAAIDRILLSMKKRRLEKNLDAIDKNSFQKVKTIVESDGKSDFENTPNLPGSSVNVPAQSLKRTVSEPRKTVANTEPKMLTEGQNAESSHARAVREVVSES